MAEDYPSRLSSQHELSRAYRDNGQNDESMMFLEHVVKIEENSSSENDPDRLASQHELARIYELNGQIDKAILLLEHVVKIQKKTLFLKIIPLALFCNALSPECIENPGKLRRH